MKKSSTLISIVLLVSLLTACANKIATSTPTSDAGNIATFVAATLSAIPSTTIMPTPTDTPVVDEWTLYYIDLYSLKISIPQGWTLSEINRRPEPTDFGDPITGHDCADYNISNSDGTLIVSLLPTCGFADGVGSSCPNDSVIIREQNDTSVIIRYFDQEKSAYIYTSGGFATISDSQGTRSEMLCSSPPILFFGEGQNLRFIQTEFQNLGTGGSMDQILATIDEIVLSIGEQ